MTMGTKTLKGKFLPQYKTAAQWCAADTVLLRGELGIESDTRKFKFGDGVTTWNNLLYANEISNGNETDTITVSETFVGAFHAREIGQIVRFVAESGTESAPDGLTDLHWAGFYQTTRTHSGQIATIVYAWAPDPTTGQPIIYTCIDLQDRGALTWTKIGEESPFVGPLPGYTRISTTERFSVATGSLYTIHFTQEIPRSTYMFVDADIRTSVTGGAQRAAVPLTFFYPKDGAIVFDLCTRSLATGTNIGFIRVNVASIVTGDNGIAGLQLVVTSHNIANVEDVVYIKGLYAKNQGGGK